MCHLMDVGYVCNTTFRYRLCFKLVCMYVHECVCWRDLVMSVPWSWSCGVCLCIYEMYVFCYINVDRLCVWKQERENYLWNLADQIFFSGMKACCSFSFPANRKSHMKVSKWCLFKGLSCCALPVAQRVSVPNSATAAASVKKKLEPSQYI